MQANHFWGLIDSSENVIVAPRFQNIKKINKTILAFSKCTLNGKTTYFDTKDKKMLTSNFPETHLISTTLAAVKDTLSNKWGLRNLQTQDWILKLIFDEFQSEGNALKSFKITPKMAYLNRKGEYIWKEKGFKLLE